MQSSTVLRASITAAVVAALLALAASAPATAGRVARVKDINGGAASSGPQWLTKMGRTVYFSATTRSLGRELWKTQGTARTTRLVRDIRKGKASSNPTEFVSADGLLYFLVDGTQLWRTKGTRASTKLIKKGLFPGLATAAVGKSLYFGARDGLWVTRGKPSNTHKVHSVRVGERMHAIGDTVYFPGRTAGHGYELWKSDGTAAGTRMVKEIVPGSGSGITDCQAFANVGPILFFNATEDPAYCDLQLWRSDGTEAGTKQLWARKTNGGGPRLLTSGNGRLYFVAADQTSGAQTGTEPWKSDGTAAGTKLLKDIYPGVEGFVGRASEPEELTMVGRTLFFAATDKAGGRELWKSNGTTSGTKRVKDIRPGRKSSYPTTLTRASNDTLFFAGFDPRSGHEPWRSKGSAKSTKRIAQIRPGPESGIQTYCTECSVALGRKVFFVGNDGKTGWELWKWTR